MVHSKARAAPEERLSKHREASVQQNIDPKCTVEGGRHHADAQSHHEICLSPFLFRVGWNAALPQQACMQDCPAHIMLGGSTCGAPCALLSLAEGNAAWSASSFPEIC